MRLARGLHSALAMDQSLLIASAGLRAQIDTLELLGNNLANSSTPGFKRDREFFRLFQTSLAEADPSTTEIRWMPVVQGSVIDFGQGPLARTEGTLDVALTGPGFLVVESAKAIFIPAPALFSFRPAGAWKLRKALPYSIRRASRLRFHQDRKSKSGTTA